MRKRYKRLFNQKSKESGAVVIFVALTMIVMFGMMGLVFDLGHAYFTRRQMQTAADAAAFAGAHIIKSLKVNEDGPETEAGIITAAIAEAERNGFTISASDVNYPPQQGNYSGDDNFVEVIVREQLPTWFFHILDKDRREMDVGARGVAGVKPEGSACIYVLNGTEDSAFKVNSDSHVYAPNCGIEVSSCSEYRALEVTSSSMLEAFSISVCGGVEDGGGHISPDPNTGDDYCPEPKCSKGEDPLNLPPPASADDPCTYDEQVEVKGTMTLSPGVYCGGIKVNEGIANFESGIYVLRGGGLEINGGSATGEGVSFYNTEGGGNDFKPFVINSTGTTVNFTAPGEGEPMAGVLFFMDKNISPGAFQMPNIIDSKVDPVLNGIFYLPTGFLKINSESNVEMAIGKIIVDTLETNSKGNLHVGNDTNGAEEPMKVTLVE